MIEASNLSYVYPFQSEPALEDVSFSVARGEALLITGPSGCGKSTLLRIINGLIPNHFKGTLNGGLTLDGICCPAPLEQVSQRVGTVLQNPDDQFMATTIEDEAALALEWRELPAATIEARVGEALKVMNLSGLARRSVFTLSQGEKQKCVLAAVLAAEPDVVVMDEPTANLSPDATDELTEVCQQLKARGITLVIVDHRLYWLRGVLDKLLVLNEGRAVFYAEKQSESDLLDQLARHPNFNDWGLRSPTVLRPSFPAAERAPEFAVEARGLSFRYPRGEDIFRDWNAVVPRGAVTAVVGRNGAGKTTLARLLTGLSRPQSGDVLFDGKPLPRKACRARTAFVMQQMEIQLYMRTVLDELLFSAPRQMPTAERKKKAEALLATFHLADKAGRHPHSLSGGEKQRLVIACALMKRPELLILDEPTSGLDGRNMKVIAQQMLAFAEAGGAVLLITHDLELLELAAHYQLSVEWAGSLK
ncbi:MAG: ABC transporter ATP-binding protein [Kiritimatiellales bacterium]